MKKLLSLSFALAMTLGLWAESFANYDMTVKGVTVTRNDNDYGTTRYFMTLTCVGQRWKTTNTFNYEVQLCLYPETETIEGKFATQGSKQVLMPINSYVKWVDNKTRYLTNDSLSTIEIFNDGNNNYRFYGGTLICQDVEFDYTGKKVIKQTLYYHFNDTVPFHFDESDKTVAVTGTSVTATDVVDGIDLDVQGTADGADYQLMLRLDYTNLAGTFTTSNGLSLWSNVATGTQSSYVTDGSTVTVTHKSGNTYTVTATLVCDNGYTYTLSATDFTYGDETGTDLRALQATSAGSKFIRNGRLMMVHNGKLLDVLGK